MLLAVADGQLGLTRRLAAPHLQAVRAKPAPRSPKICG